MEEESKFIIQYIVPAVISSSVLTALITQLFSYFSSNKKNNLEYITKERDIWRKDLREVCSKISKIENKEELHIHLDYIKVRINPFGHSKWSEEVSIRWAKYDGYLWSIIEKIENDINDSSFNLEKYKEELVYSISLLLKLDWERSKNEIKGNKFKVLTYGMILIVEAITLVFLSSLIKIILTNTAGENISLFIAIGIYLFTPFFIKFYSFEMGDTIKEYLTIIFMIVILPVFSNVILCMYTKNQNLSIGELVILIMLYIIILLLVSAEIGSTYYGKIQKFFKDEIEQSS